MQSEIAPGAFRVNKLRQRGFPNKTVTYKWYSWLLFKEFAKQYKMHIEEVLADKDTFMDILHQVNRYYQRSPESPEKEGLQEYKGPQTYDDRTKRHCITMAKVGTNGTGCQNLKSKCQAYLEMIRLK